MHVHKINACTFKFIKNQTYACMHTTLKNGLKMLKIGTDILYHCWDFRI